MRSVIKNKENLKTLHAVNERNFTVVVGETDYPGGRLAGANLDFPVVHVMVDGFPLEFEISWALAKRLASGEATRVIY